MDQRLLTEKANELIKSDKFPQIKESHKEYVTRRMLEEQIKFLAGEHDINESTAHTSQTAGVANWDPVLIRMVRRSAPQLMAFDLAGVQPMSGPTGSIFAMRARYASQTGPEALHNEADSGYSGVGTQGGDTSGFPADFLSTGVPAADTTYGTGMSTAAAELLGTNGNPQWKEMTFSIERTDVSAKSRKLKASFTRELQHDLKQIHGLDAESELANILSTEIVAEQDRELLRTINVSAVIGAQDAATPGVFDLSADSDGRWLVEKFKGLLFQMELEANAIAKITRRGKANRVICSANVASALNMAGVLDYNPQMAAALNVDITSNTFAGILLGRYQVHVDPYAEIDYITMGYKGANAWDAGVYWCPYVPLQMVRATAEDSFQPRLGFETRYGIKANPFVAKLANGSNKPGEGLGQGENEYFRKFMVVNLQG